MALAAALLEDIRQDKDVQHCLECLWDSKNILLWLKKETKGLRIFLACKLIIHFVSDVSDLSNFVTVALATAAGGEDALTQDKLSGLRTIGTSFESLIYTLPPTAGYKELLSSCQTLVKTIRKNRYLPTLLVCQNLYNIFLRCVGTNVIVSNCSK